MSRKIFTIEKSFGDRLAHLIDNILKIDRKKFLEKVRISQSYLSAMTTPEHKIKKGKKRRGPSAELIGDLFILYREYLDWLLTGEEPIERQISLEIKDPKIDQIVNMLLSDPLAKNTIFYILESKMHFERSLEFLRSYMDDRMKLEMEKIKKGGQQ